MPIYTSLTPLALESGQELPELTLAYQTYGQLNANADNVVWICHALTANADAASWWPGIIGPGALFDTNTHFIVCANMLGSCYGSSGPLSINPLTDEAYYHDFPRITPRDMANALQRLRHFLGIRRAEVLVGGSMGGQQAIEWAIEDPDFAQELILLATNARHSAWGIAFNESQRLALLADPTFAERRPDAGQAGLRAARATALLSYRSYSAYADAQTDPEPLLSDFRAASYQQYQGDKLVRRFNAFSYWVLSQAMDAHHVGRGRGSLEEALQRVRARTLCIGIPNDVLFPPEEQQLLARLIPNAQFVELHTPYGHDGFLIETAAITQLVKAFRASSTEKKYAYAS